jgi:hypothetical protein
MDTIDAHYQDAYMIRVKRSFLLLLLIALFGLGLVVGIKVTQALTLTVVYQPIAPTRLFVANRPPSFSTLQQMTSGATTDEEAYRRVVDYFSANRQDIADELQEENETRLKALFVMNVVHISHVYDSVTDPGSFLDYLKQSGSHCGTYSHYEGAILEQFALLWRTQNISGGTHTWVEVNVDGQWEIFDATINTWIDHSGAELMRGSTRTYRYFYTPMLDAARTDVVNPYLESAQELRTLMPGLGLYYFPLALIVS